MRRTTWDRPRMGRESKHQSGSSGCSKQVPGPGWERTSQKKAGRPWPGFKTNGKSFTHPTPTDPATCQTRSRHQRTRDRNAGPRGAYVLAEDDSE